MGRTELYKEDVNMKSKAVKIMSFVVGVYVVLLLSFSVLHTQLFSNPTDNNEAFESRKEQTDEFFMTSHGYKQPLQAVVEINTKKLKQNPIDLDETVLLSYLDGHGDEEACLEVWKEIKELSDSICQDVEAYEDVSEDYVKVYELAKYVAFNYYYDWDGFDNVSLDTINLATVMETHKATCAGYSNMFAALCEAQGYKVMSLKGGTPSTLIDIGYEDIVDSPTNHEWSAVYVDDRWVFVDITWLSANSYKEETFLTGKFAHFKYFDMDFEFMCTEHRIDVMEYRNFGKMGTYLEAINDVKEE